MRTMDQLVADDRARELRAAGRQLRDGRTLASRLRDRDRGRTRARLSHRGDASN